MPAGGEVRRRRLQSPLPAKWFSAQTRVEQVAVPAGEDEERLPLRRR
jgi:hypothetical protein